MEDWDNIKSSRNNNLIVNYLPHDIDDLALKGLFAEFGEILISKVVRDKNTKKSLGYGFVKFVSEDDAYYAIEKMNGFSLGNKHLKVSIARPASLEIRNCKLYVTNLPREFTERDVMLLFKEYGEIIECRVLPDLKNPSFNRGVAFVQYNLKSQANSALVLNGFLLQGSSKPLGVKYAEDQHKKKELNRLNNLTANNVMRDFGLMGNMQMGMGMPGMHDMEMRARMHHDILKNDMAPMYNHAQPILLNTNFAGGPTGFGPHSPVGPAHHIFLPAASTYATTNMKQQQDLNHYISMKQTKPKTRNKKKNGSFQDEHLDQHDIQPDPISISNYNHMGPLHFNPFESNMIGISPPGSPHHGIPIRLASAHSSMLDQLPSPLTYELQDGMALPMQIPISPPHSPGSLVSPYSNGPVNLDLINLPSHADKNFLFSLFAPYGKLLSASIIECEEVRDSDDSSKDSCEQKEKKVIKGQVKMAGFAQAEYAAHQINARRLSYEKNQPIKVAVVS